MLMSSRLLQINQITEAPVFSRVFDPYVLLSINIERVEKAHTLYWRLQSPRHMIDVGIKSDTGELISLTIVLYRDLIRSSPAITAKTDGATEGIPIFSLDCWQIKDPYDNSEYYSVHDGDFSICLKENDLWITLYPDPIENFVGLPGVILCLINHNGELCGFVIENLTQQELDALRQFETLWAGLES